MEGQLTERVPKSGIPLAGLSAIYLVTPVFLFAWGWLRWPYALATTLVAAIFVTIAVRDIWVAWQDRGKPGTARQVLRAIWPALLIITAWLFLSGTGGFGLQNGDYISSNALLKGLITNPWPLQIEFEGQTVNIAYYIGYYLPAAGIGKLLGWQAANIFIFIWTLIGIVLAFLWFWRISALRMRLWPLFLLALIFCLGSGMDAVGYYLLEGHPFVWGEHIETWAHLFQFTSQTALIYWVPQHALAAWLTAGMTFECLEDARLFRYLGMAVAASILWSPFGVVGIVPYLLGLGISLLARKQARVLIAPLSLVLNSASLWIAAVYLLYILSNQYKFPKGLLWNLVASHNAYIIVGIAFWCIEFGLLAISVVFLGGFVQHARKAKGMTNINSALRWGWLALVCLVLSVLLLFKMGYNNDLVMRGSIPSLFYFWAFIAQGLVEAVPYFKQKRIEIVHALTVCLLLIGSFTSLSEIIRSVGIYHFGPPDAGEVQTIATASSPYIVAQRIGDKDAPFFRYLGR